VVTGVRGIIVRELVKASESLKAAHAHATNLGDEDLAFAIRETAFSVGVAISAANTNAAQERNVIS
jgi:hypothetical protein